jgi:cyanophycinase
VYYDTLLKLYGAAEVYYIPVTVNTTSENANPDVVEKVKTLTGFFFGGGDQLRIIQSFFNYNAKVPSPVLRAIKETLFATGGVVAGTSAGTDCQTDRVMITGGESYKGRQCSCLTAL